MTTSKMLWITAALLLSAACGSVKRTADTAVLPVSADPVIANDPRMTIGKLPNGLTYYVMRNDKPEGRASFHIVHSVGAVQEKDAQVGLAHFLEHMAFNGTKNFPDKRLIEYLEENGVAFGSNINAYTSMDVTSYMLKDVPVRREGLVDSALLILHDWSHFITLDSAEVNKERGVIQDELRRGDNASRRIFEVAQPIIYNNSIYGRRNVIGTMEVLKNFKQEEIVDFYHRWYRPDLQAVIVIGDIDPQQIIRKLESLFADIPAVEDPRPKERVVIEDYQEDTAKLLTDKEQTNTYAQVVIPVEDIDTSLNDRTSTDLQRIAEELLSSVLNERLGAIAQTPDAPFASAYASDTELTSFRKVFYGMVATPDDKLTEGVERLGTEIARFRQYGATDGELRRAKENLLKSSAQAYENRSDRKNSQFVDAAQEHFLTGTPVFEIESDFNRTRSFLDTVSQAYLNSRIAALIPDKPFAVIGATTPDNFKNFSDEALLNAFRKGLNAAVEPPAEEEIFDGLTDGEPQPVAAVSTTQDPLGATVWKFANGATVVFRPTDFKQDEIIFSAFKKGGETLLPDSLILVSDILNSFLRSGMAGVGKFNAVDLDKVLSGKQAEATPAIDRYRQKLSGGSSSKDLKELMQLIYLRFTAPRLAPEEFGVFRSRLKTVLQNPEADPATVFMDSVQVALGGGINTGRITTQRELLDNIDAVTAADLEKVYDRFFNGAEGMTFLFVGAADTAEMRMLAERYIGSLPAGTPGGYGAFDTADAPRSADHKFVKEQEQHKSKVFVLLKGEKEFSGEDILAASALNDILFTRYIETIREEMGATYGVNVSISLNRNKKPEFTFFVLYDTSDSLVAPSSAVILNELRAIAEQGPDPLYLRKAKEKMAAGYETGQKQNGWWLNRLTRYYGEGENPYAEGKAAIEAVAAEAVQRIAAEIAEGAPVVRVIMVSDPKAL